MLLKQSYDGGNLLLELTTTVKHRNILTKPILLYVILVLFEMVKY